MGARVLLAEDAQINRLVGVALLERLGYIVDVVTNGAEAVEAVQRTRYDAVLMDCFMPVMDGYEATDRIRTRELGGARGALEELLPLLGLDSLLAGEERADPEAERLLAERERARSAKDFERADTIRDQLAELGWEVRDGADGARLVRRG